MGFSFFRSIRYGPLRFNVSGRGIGVSAGIRGFRVGSGPRGAYINAGRHGFRYRASLGSGASASAPASRASASPTPAAPPSALPDDAVDTTVYETRDIMQLSDANGGDLLAMLNAQAKHKARWPLALIGGVLILGYAYSRLGANPPLWTQYAVGALAFVLACALVWVAWKDRLRKLTVLCYELDETTANAFESFTKAWQSVAAVQSLWTIPRSTQYSDKKYHGGATTGVSRTPTRVTFGAPKNVRCNVAVPLISSGATTFAFYPDRLLVFRGNQVGAVAYSTLQAQPTESRFNEEERVPNDTQVVGRTWRYVNKSGGPDRRFKNNREIPVCTYSDLKLTSGSGLTAYFMASKPKVFDIVPKAIELLRVLERHSQMQVPHHY